MLLFRENGLCPQLLWVWMVGCRLQSISTKALWALAVQSRFPHITW